MLQLGNTALTGGVFGSLLYHDLREQRGYVYFVNSVLRGGKKRSTFEITYGADPKNVEAAARLVSDDLASLQKKPLAADRLMRAKAIVVGSLPIEKESYDGLAGQLLAYSSTDRPLDYDRISAAAQLGTTPDSLRAAFKRWIRPDGFVRVVQVPAK
ncbi:MAG: insulinase family protein [Candidatus Eremiobacteraeota bacterium]|nr:insulinase family protein [Candidatus Eremiobacteraeota bacterium]